MAVAGSVVIEMAANVARLKSDFDKASAATAHAFGTIQRSVKTALTAVEAMVSGMAIHRMWSMVEGALAAGDAIQKMSARVGIAVVPLQELQHAARMSGVGMEDLGTGLKFLNKNLGEAGAGSETAAQLFRDLGIGVRDAGGNLQSAGDVLDALADKIQATENPAERTRLALAALGKSGDQWIPMLKDGREGLAKMREEANRLGLVLDADLVASAEKSKDAVDRLTLVIQTNLTKALLASGPVIETWVTRWTDGFASIMKSVSSFITPTALQNIGSLKEQIAAADAELLVLQDRLQKPGVDRGFIAGQITDLTKLRLELTAALKAKNDLAAAQSKKVGGVGEIVSAATLEAIDKLKQKILDLAVPDPVANSIMKFRAEIEKLATSPGLSPKESSAVRALGADFEKLKQDIDATSKAITDAQASASASTLGATGAADTFAGLDEIDALRKAAGETEQKITDMARAGTPVSQLFPLIGEASSALAAKLDALRQKYADQPIVLDALKAKMAGMDFGDFGRKLDDIVRGLGGVTQGSVTVTDAAGNIERTWVPALQNSGIAVLDFDDTLADLRISVGDTAISAGMFATALGTTQAATQATIAALDLLAGRLFNVETMFYRVRTAAAAAATA